MNRLITITWADYEADVAWWTQAAKDGAVVRVMESGRAVLAFGYPDDAELMPGSISTHW